MERKEVTRMLVGVQPQGQGTIRVVGAKLHGIVVTESKLNYHGSITIDTDILEAARLLPLEYVYIWNKHSGSRIETYVLPGPRGSGVVCLNGAAPVPARWATRSSWPLPARSPSATITTDFPAAC